MLWFGAIRRGFGLARVILLAFALPLFASCTKPTVFPHYLTVADVINNVKCELYAAIWDSISEDPRSVWLDKWAAAFSVQLQVKRQTVGNGDFTFVVPYNVPVGVFTLVAGGSLDKSGQSRMVFTFAADKNLKAFRSQDQCAYFRQRNGRNNLAGETGLRLWFTNVIEGFNQARVKSTSLTYTLEFVTTVDGHIKPSFRSTYPSKRIFAGEFGIDHKRTDDNTLTIAFTPPAPSAAPFAATELGKALARIEALLADKKAKQAALQENVRSAQSTIDSLSPVVSSMQAREKTLTPQDAIALKEQAESLAAAQTKKANSLKDLQAVNRDIEVLQAARSGTQASAAALAQTAPASTDQRLNQLLLLDAVRDIPR